MVVSPLLQLLFALVTIVAACMIVYKLSLPLALKIMNLSMESARFRKGICFFLAFLFCAMGVLQLIDFMEETSPGLSRFFPLFFLNAGIMVYLGSVKQRLTK